MLVVVKEYNIGRGYEMVLSDNTRIYINKSNPTQDEKDLYLYDYEWSILDKIDIKGEEDGVQYNDADNRQPDPGEDITLGLPQS